HGTLFLLRWPRARVSRKPDGATCPMGTGLSSHRRHALVMRHGAVGQEVSTAAERTRWQPPAIPASDCGPAVARRPGAGPHATPPGSVPGTWPITTGRATSRA